MGAAHHWPPADRVRADPGHRPLGAAGFVSTPPTFPTFTERSLHERADAD